MSLNILVLSFKSKLFFRKSTLKIRDIFFDNILNLKPHLFIFSEIFRNSNKQFLLADILNIADIVRNHPKMYISDVILVHFLLNKLTHIDPIREATE